MSDPIIQVAGVLDAAEAKMLSDAGANYLGIPLRLKDGREDQTEAEAREIVAAVGDAARMIAITYVGQADEIVELCNFVGVAGVQLHGDVQIEELAKLREHRPELVVIKSLVVRDDNLATLEAVARDLSPFVDAFITDTFDPTTGRCGATGIAHDWSVSRMLVEASPKPVILAGGLDAENVGEAVHAVRPAGVDAHTRLEGPDGRKDEAKVRRFVAKAREALEAIR